MKQEDKELLLKDLCARLPYGVKVNVKGVIYDNRSCRLTDIHYGLNAYIGVPDGMQYHIESIKPYLFPLSSLPLIIEEHEDEFNKIIDCQMQEIESNDIMLSAFVTEMHLYNKYHIDYNNLIPKGLANDATGLNIY